MRFLALTPLKFRNLEIKIGDTFRVKSEDALKSLLDNGMVRPLQYVLGEKYQELCKWLKSYPVTDVEIKQAMPEHWQKLQDAIAEMDNYFLNENLQGFNEAMGKVKEFYFEAVDKVKQVFPKKCKG